MTCVCERVRLESFLGSVRVGRGFVARPREPVANCITVQLTAVRPLHFKISVSVTILRNIVEFNAVRGTPDVGVCDFILIRINLPLLSNKIIY